MPHEDAAFNLSRLSLLIAGLADHSQLLATSGDDRIHQGPRSALFPEAPALLDGLRQAGALTSCWSGAGPSLLGICAAGEAEAVAGGAKALMGEHGVPGNVLLLEADPVSYTHLPKLRSCSTKRVRWCSQRSKRPSSMKPRAPTSTP